MFIMPDGITYRQFDYWVRQGWINVIDNGPHTMRDITESEYKVLMKMSVFVNDGVHPKVASQMARDLISKGTFTLGGTTWTKQSLHLVKSNQSTNTDELGTANERRQA